MTPSSGTTPRPWRQWAADNRDTTPLEDALDDLYEQGYRDGQRVAEADLAEARAAIERARRYIVQNRDVWDDEPTDPPGARQLANAYRDIYQKVLNVLESRVPLDNGLAAHPEVGE